ncbi:Alkaline phosphatase synthesis sensor protein phoR [uncultured Clostridium sp.]|uniref:sensor histidine kinase n=1 Tax=uncultured Clostridium sp. TaxID=59620 RepID=UPI000822C03C|nr:HAMP domain-containing sensor histidine kinase [uncultured Clostridium sp.]SCI76619.1 Alkaline phosphatase synthesis sensor protein phoR [uncultured Clostridium sp.]
MDIKLKSNNVKESKGIVATIVTLLIISIASIVMCKSYPVIDKNAQNVKENYFDGYGFSGILAETSYVKYFDSVSEKSGGNITPAEVLLDYNKNVYSNEEEYYDDSYADGFNSSFNNWSRNINERYRNLLYYSYDKQNDIKSTNISEGVSIKDKNIEVSSLNKEQFQFFVSMNFDENGVLSISDIQGADKQNFEYYLKNNLNNLDTYYDITMNPIKNMSFVYAVPKTLVYDDTISWGIRNSNMAGYEIAGAVAVMIILAVISIAALIFPLKKSKNMALFNGLSKIPLELWIAICTFATMLIVVSPRYMVKPTLDGDIEYIFGFLVDWITVSTNTVWFLNFLNWFVCFGIVFFAVLVIKYIFNIGIKEYFKRRTIVGWIITKIVRAVRRTLDAVTSVDLSKKNNKLLLKLVIINALILLLITSIWFFGIPVVIIYSIILFFIAEKYVEKISAKYSILKKATNKIAEGKLDVEIQEDLGLFEPFKDDLEKIQSGFKKAVDEEVKSQKMKTDLISNVSHDLKTPLTAIITYADLLKDENLSEDKRRQYVETLDRKAQRLQVLIEDLFEMSKASSGNITLNIENIDVISLMKQTILELEDKLQEAELTVRTNFPGNKIILPLDSQRTFRVFENLVINMTKYAMKGTRAYIDIIETDKEVEIIMKNMAAEEINFNVDTIAERFVRGDESRNTEGSGLGLAIAKSFVELQGGRFNISVDGDLFKVTIKFDKITE